MKRLWILGKIDELNAVHNKIGISEDGTDLIDEYIFLFRKIFEDNIEKYIREDFVVGIDVANGATYKVAENVFKKLGIKYKIINNNPNGININENCGSTHLEGLKKFVLENKLSLGIAYDGDGDRCLAIDEKGNEINGDVLLAIFSNYLKEKNSLNKNTVVATVMSNLGLNKFGEKNGITIKQTKVGDRYVLEEMLKNGYNLGGEQSGHIIMLDYNPTGDGILTSLMLIQIILEKNISASELSKIIDIYPQVLLNAKVSNSKKKDYAEDAKIKEKVQEVDKEFSNEGRVLIRESGTEPLIRVMIEGKNQELITQKAKELVEIIEDRLN